MSESDEMANLFAGFDQMTASSRDVILKPPFAYPGGKSKSVKHILDHLPYEEIYVEPFGGSAAVLLGRQSSKLEVFNDRYAGVTSFYRCVRDPKLFQALCDWIECTVHSREEFVGCKATWKDFEDPVERAARWYYMTMYSFGRLGRNFGRSTSSKARLISIRDKLAMFPDIHARFKNVQVENQDWEQCMRDYDSPVTVFYLDPPYIDADLYMYENNLTSDQHRNFLDLVFDLEGFAAISGYTNPLYEDRPWDNRIEWESFVSLKSMAYAEGNHKEHLQGQEKRGHAKEVLWIKEAQ